LHTALTNIVSKEACSGADDHEVSRRQSIGFDHHRGPGLAHIAL
jgi:hypothetical protein